MILDLIFAVLKRCAPLLVTNERVSLPHEQHPDQRCAFLLLRCQDGQVKRCYAFDILLVDLGPAGQQVAQGGLIRVEDDPVHGCTLLRVDLVDVEVVAVKQVCDHCRLVPLRGEE